MHVHCQFYGDWQERARELSHLLVRLSGFGVRSVGIWALAFSSALALLAFARDSHYCIKGEGSIMLA